MANSYEFDSFWELNIGQTVVCVILGICTLTLAILFSTVVGMYYGSPKIVVVVLISLFFIFFYLLYKMSLFFQEKYHITFDNESIEISSSKREKQTFLLSQLYLISYERENYLLCKTVSIDMYFSQKNETTFLKWSFNTNEIFCASTNRKNNYIKLTRFLADFNMQILPSRFKAMKRDEKRQCLKKVGITMRSKSTRSFYVQK